MVGLYERRKSRAAFWCLRLAVISVPFFILTVFLHRSAGITTSQAFWLIAFGIALLIGSVLFGMRAAVDLWERGYQGGRATVNGIVLAVVMLIPFGMQMVNALEHPQLNDVSTDVLDPPLLLAPIEGAAKPDADGILYDEFNARRIVAAYPQLVARRYNAPPERVAVSVVELLKRWRWRLTGGVNLPVLETEKPEGDEENEELAGDETELSELQPDENGEVDIPDIIIQAEARSLIMKLPSHLVIRLSVEGESTLVDMRSLTVWGKHDFGSNADNITAFLKALDESLAGLAGEG